MKWKLLLTWSAVVAGKTCNIFGLFFLPFGRNRHRSLVGHTSTRLGSISVFLDAPTEIQFPGGGHPLRSGPGGTRVRRFVFLWAKTTGSHAVSLFLAFSVTLDLIYFTTTVGTTLTLGIPRSSSHPESAKCAPLLLFLTARPAAADHARIVFGVTSSQATESNDQTWWAWLSIWTLLAGSVGSALKKKIACCDPQGKNQNACT